MIQPKTYLIAIAISNYLHLPDLKYATQESKQLQALLTEKYCVELLEELHDEKAIPKNVNNIFNKLKQQPQKGNSILFFFNGHGRFHNGEPHFQMYNSEVEHPHTWYPFSQLMGNINELEGLKDIAFCINACEMGTGYDIISNVNLHSVDEQTRIILTAGSGVEKVQAISAVYTGYSPFVGCMMEQLKWNTALDLSVMQIYQFMDSKFKEYGTPSTPKYHQLAGHGGTDFVLRLNYDEAILWQEAETTASIETRIEKYQIYEQLFPYSEKSKDVNQIVQKLTFINDAWYECNQKMKEALDTFGKLENLLIHQKLSNNVHDLQANCLKILTDIEYSRLKNADVRVEDIDIETDVPIQKIQTVIDQLQKRIEEGKNVKQYMVLKEHFEAQQEQFQLWQKCNDKRKSVNDRKANCWESLAKFPTGKYAGPISAKKADMENWLRIEKEPNLELKLDKVIYYLDQPQPECVKEAKKLRAELEERLKLQETKKSYEATLYEAIGNINKMYDIKLNLEQISEDLKPEYESIIGLVNEDIETQTQKVRQKYETVLKQQNIAEMYKFYKQYKDVKLENLKTLLETVKLKLDEIDDKWFNDAEVSRLTADYEKYIEILGQINEFRTKKASDRIEEIQFYEGLKSKEDFEAYREQYQEDGLFMPEVTEKLAVLNVAEQKRIAKDDFAAKLNSETFEIFQRLLIGDEDDETMKLLEKGKEIQRQKAADEALQFLLECQNDTKLQLKLCEQYNNKFPNTNHSDAVNEIRLQIIDLKDNDAFNDAETENSIPAWDKYLNNGLDKSPKREKEAQERKKILEDIETEKQDFEVAQKSKEGCVIYIGKYGEKGKFYEEVAKLFAKRELNIKDEDTKMSHQLHKTHEAIANLSGSIQQWTENQAVQYESQQKVLWDKLDALKKDHSAAAIESQHQPLLDKLEDLKVSNIATTEKLVAKIVEGFKEETTANSNGFQGQMKEDFKSVSDKQAQTNHNINDLTLSIKELVGKLEVHLTQQTVHFKDNLEQQEAIQKSLNALPNAVGKGFTESLDKSLQTKEKDAQNEVKQLTEAVLSMVSSNADKAKATKNEMTEQVKEIKDNFDEKEQKIGKMLHAMDDDQKEMKNIFAEHQKDLLNVFKDIRDGLLRSEKQSGENYQELAKSFKDFTAKQQESIDASKKESKENQQELSKTFKEFTNKQQESIEQEESNQKALSKIFNEVTNEQRESIKRFEKHEKENHQALLDALNGFTSKQDEVIQSAEGNQQKLLGAFRTFANSSEKQSETQLEKISEEMKLNAKNQTVTIIVRLLTIIVLGYFIYWIYQNFFMHKVNAFL